MHIVRTKVVRNMDYENKAIFRYEAGMERERNGFYFIARHAGSDFPHGWGLRFSGFICRMMR
jgi:hypothetical protein